MLELNTAAITRLADLMERFKPNAATIKVEGTTATIPGPSVETLKAEDKKAVAEMATEIVERAKKKAPAKKVTLVDPPGQRVKTTETPKATDAEVIEVIKEVELVDIQKVARALVIKGKDVKAAALAAIEAIAGKGAKIHSLDKKFYAEVLAALEALQANLEEV